jgi:hypothetical protein
VEGHNKFHSLPSLQSICQKPSFMSHFAIKILTSPSALANAWMIHDRHSPTWSMAPLGTLFSVVSFTATRMPPLASRNRNDRSRIDRKAFDLCGIAAIGDILSLCGGLSFILSHTKRRACFVQIFSVISSAKCASASGESADRCGPLATASQILFLVQQ